MEIIMNFIDHYAYIVLILSLSLGILALPFPLEAIMGYTGLLAYQGKTSWLLCILAASFGSFLGMAIAYWIGHKLGMPFFERYGKRIHLGPERIKQTSKWFNRYGNKIIIIAFFIPGVRHFTGYFAGIIGLNFKTFSLYTIAGSLLWVSPIVLLGKMLGPNWEVFLEVIKKYLVVGGIVTALVILLFLIIKKYKKNIILNLTLLMNNVLGFLKS